MKITLVKYIVLAITLVPSLATAQLTLDHVNAPFNDVVLKYTLNHFNLKGNVSKIVEGTPEDGLVITTLFKNGRITERLTTGEWGAKETYDYSNADKIVLRRNDTITGTFLLKDGNITSYDTQEGLNIEIIYNQNGSVQGRITIGTEKASSLYTYDSKGRLEMVEHSDDNGSRQSVDTYKYGKEGNYLTVLNENFDAETQDHFSSNIWVDQKGFVFFDEHPSAYEFTYDAEGNWVSYSINGENTVKRTIHYN